MTRAAPAVADNPADPALLVAVTSAAPPAPQGSRPGVRGRLVGLVDRVGAWIDRLLGPGARWSALPPGRRVTVGWLVTRAIMLVLLAIPENTVISDVTYYFDNLSHLAAGAGVTDVLHEYPLPVLLLVGIPYLFSFGNRYLYGALFVLLMFVVDACFCRLLFLRAGRQQSAAVTLWLAAAVMMGPLMITRFDQVTGVLTGAAVIVLARRPRLATLFVTVGAALKLWPAVLIPALAAPRSTRVKVLVTAALSGLLVVGTILAIGGVERLLSPLHYQSDRGLQIESLPALPFMVLWSLFREPWMVKFSSYITSQVYGPGVPVMITLATVASALAVAWMAAVWVRAWRLGDRVDAETVGWIILASTFLLLLTNKVFSPQYLLWLAPVAIAMVAVAPARDTGVRRLAVFILIIGVLTQVIYPICYIWISETSWINPFGVAQLVIRDACLVGAAVYTVSRAWRETARLGEP